jgi:hypothetical protein
LGAFETALALTDEYSPFNVVAIVRLSGSPAPDVLRRALEDAESSICRFAERLFAHPHTVSKQDLDELRQLGLDEGRRLDLIFRVAILAGLDKLAAVAEIHPELFR